MSATTTGAVVSRHASATEVGIDVLAAGGNAFDAAVAVGFAIGVLDVGMCGLGGGFFMLVYRTADGRSGVIDGPVVAPALAPEAGFEIDPLGARGIYGFPAVRDRANVVGHRSVAVPGAVAGLCATRDLLGTLPLDRLVEPAAVVAEDGFDLSWADLAQLAMGRATLESHSSSAATFLPWGNLPTPAFQYPTDEAPRIHQPDLARTLRQIGAEGADAFYRGGIADAIDAEIRRGDGWLRKSDLAEYRVEVGAATTGTYRGWGLTTGPDWVVLEVLGILERFDLAGLNPTTRSDSISWPKPPSAAMPTSTSTSPGPRARPMPATGISSKHGSTPAPPRSRPSGYSSDPLLTRIDPSRGPQAGTRRATPAVTRRATSPPCS